MRDFHGVRVRVDPTMPEDEIRLENQDGSTALTIRNIGKSKAIEPTSYYSPSLAKRLANEDGTYGSIVRTVTTSMGREEKFRTPPENPDIQLWRQGFTRNPATCPHERKRYTDATMRWRCRDCGTWEVR